MARVHREFDFLLQSETPSDFVPDLVYRPPFSSTWPPECLVVDYELPRLRKLRPQRFECAELEDMLGPFNTILIYVSQFDAIQQVERDVHSAARLLTASGHLRAVILPKGRPRKVNRLVSAVFKQVRAATRSGTTLIVCNQPESKHFTGPCSELSYTDSYSTKELKFETRAGMFSCNRIDAGTEFLLSFLPDLQNCEVLDVGCGYGIIGAVCAARGARSTMIDADARAVKLSRKNLTRNGLSGEILLDDEIRQPGGAFKLAVSNPPTHAGSLVLQSLFLNMVRVCAPCGYALIVVRQHLNYEKWLLEIGIVETLGISAGYKVLRINGAARKTQATATKPRPS